MIDNGRMSTILITILGAVATFIFADPAVMKPIFGVYYSQFYAILPLLVTIYNAYFPRQEKAGV